MTLFVISPDYLDAMIAETKKYSFTLQGYGNVEDARLGLRKTNLGEILGFIYFGKNLPKDTEVLKRFVRLLNLACKDTRKKFLFVGSDVGGIASILPTEYRNNLDVEVFSDYPYVTDTMINRELIGNILLANYSPYKMDEKPDDSLPLFSGTPRLKYEPIFPSYLLRFFEGVQKRRDSASTILYDQHLKELDEKDACLAMLRRLQIRFSFGEMDFELQSKIIQMIEQVEDAKDYCCKKALLYLICNERMGEDRSAYHKQL